MVAPDVALMLVSDRHRLPANDTLADVVREAARAGIAWVQVRERDLLAGQLLVLVRELVRAVEGTATRVLVNSRPDVAVAARAHGVQLPEAGLPVSEVKRAFPGLVVGASRHSLDGAERARAEGADLLVVGPVYPTTGKAEALGLEGFARIAGAATVPVYAIGGIAPATARAAVAAGASGLAAIGAFLETPLADAVAAIRGELR